MPIPNVWPDGRSRLNRCVNNIAANRIAPGAAIQVNRFIEGTITGLNGQPRACILDFRASTNDPNHHIRLPASICKKLDEASRKSPDRFVGLLAMHRRCGDNSHVLDCWIIPTAVVMRMHAMLPEDSADQSHLRNIDIRWSREERKWHWYAPSRPAIQIDITEHYAPWNLSAEEQQYIAEGIVDG